MTTEIPAGGFSSAPIDGLLGLATETQAVNPSWAPTIFGNIVSSFGLPDIFGLCLTPTQGGVLDLGFADSAKYSGALQWIPTVQERWYNMALLDVALNNVSIGLPPAVYSYLNDQIGSFIDSGTSAILFGPAIYNSFQALFQSQYCALPQVCGPKSIFSGNCISDADMAGNLGLFPTISFTFMGEKGAQVHLNVTSQFYLLHTGGSYCLAVASAVGVSAVLGDPFMEPFYIVHDRAQSRVGFGELASCA